MGLLGVKIQGLGESSDLSNVNIPSLLQIEQIFRLIYKFLEKVFAGLGITGAQSSLFC